MKLNINKLQSGGRVYFSAVANPWSNSAEADRLAKAASSSKDSGLIPDKLLEKLSEKGNPNDVNKFMGMLAKFEQLQDFGRGVSKSLLYGLQSYANQIIKQAEYLDKAEKRAETNGALDEYAVDSHGYLYTAGEKGTVKKVHASEFKFGEDVALTVGELIQLRRFNANETDNENITTTVGSNIGTEKINDYIQGIIKAVGTTSDSSEAYQDLATIVGREAAKKPSAQQLESVRQLYELSQQLGPDAIFKIKDSESSKNIQEAMSYIMSMLPNNMRTQLVARNVASGGKYENSNKYAYDIVANALNAGNTQSFSHGISYQAAINKGAGTLSGNKMLQNKNMTVLEQLVLGSLGKRDFNLVSSKNPEFSMTLHGSGVGSLANFNNNIVDKTPLTVAMSEALGPLVDLNHIFIGDQKISSASFDTILYNGGDVINVWAPTDSNGDIDFDGMQRFLELQKYFDNHPDLSIEEKNNLLVELGFNGLLDELGNFHGTGNMAQFLVMTGLTSDEVINPKENLYADLVSKLNKDMEMRQIDRIYGLLNKGIKDKDARLEFQKGFFSTDLVKAPIFMKLNQTALIDVGTFSDHGPLVQTRTYGEQLAYDQAKYNAPKIQTPSTNYLYGGN